MNYKLNLCERNITLNDWILEWFFGNKHEKDLIFVFRHRNNRARFIHEAYINTGFNFLVDKIRNEEDDPLDHILEFMNNPRAFTRRAEIRFDDEGEMAIFQPYNLNQSNFLHKFVLGESKDAMLRFQYKDREFVLELLTSGKCALVIDKDGNIMPHINRFDALYEEKIKIIEALEQSFDQEEMLFNHGCFKLLVEMS